MTNQDFSAESFHSWTRSPESFREWISHHNERPELRELALDTVDVFEQILLSSPPSSELTGKLADAAMHSHQIVWEIGLSSLLLLGESRDDARSFIAEMAHSRKMEHRRRSIRYLTDRHPRSFSIAILSTLLQDRSGKIRGFAAGQIERLNLRELIPVLERAVEQESQRTVRFEIELSLALLRRNYFEYENTHGYALVLRCEQLFPPVHYWPGRIAGEPVSRDAVARHGIAIAFDEMRRNSGQQAVNTIRRPWTLWPEAAHDRP